MPAGEGEIRATLPIYFIARVQQSFGFYIFDVFRENKVSFLCYGRAGTLHRCLNLKYKQKLSFGWKI